MLCCIASAFGCEAFQDSSARDVSSPTREIQLCQGFNLFFVGWRDVQVVDYGLAVVRALGGGESTYNAGIFGVKRKVKVCVARDELKLQFN